MKKKTRKIAASDQSGFFQSFQGNPLETSTRDEYLSKKDDSPIDRSIESLYNLGSEHKESEATVEPTSSPHLSTRYVPGYVGLQARRVGDGVVQNPLTGEVFDYNEGFKVGDKIYNPGAVSMQTSLMHFANHLDSIGLVKEADYIDELIKRAYSK